MALAIPHPLEFIKKIWGIKKNFKNSNNSFRLSKSMKGLPFFKGGKLPQIEYISFFFNPSSIQQ
jgi:hypothetical protein